MNTHKSISILSVISMLSAGIGIFSSVIMARLFGVGEIIEVYYASLVVLTVTIKFTQTGALSNIFLPEYQKLSINKSQEYANRIFSIILIRLFLYALAIALIFYVSAPLLVRFLMPGFSSYQKLMGVRYISTLVFALPFIVVNSFIIIPFNANSIYGRVELLSVLNKLILIFVLIASYRFVHDWSLVLAFVSGVFFQFVASLYLLRKYHFKLSFSIKSSDYSFKHIYRKMMSTATYAGASQIYALVFTASATLLPQGYYATYKYIERIFVNIQNISIRSIGKVFFTDFSKAVHATSESYKAIMTSAFKKSIMITTFITVNLVAVGQIVLRLLWHNEKFPAEYIETGYTILLVFLVTLFINSISHIYSKANISFQRIHLQYGLNSLIMIISSITVWWLAVYYGLAGVLSAKLIEVLLIFFSGIYIYKRAETGVSFPWTTLLRILTVSIVILFIYFLIYSVLQFTIVLNYMEQFLMISGISIILSVSYLFLGHVMKIWDMGAYYRMIFSKS